MADKDTWIAEVKVTYTDKVVGAREKLPDPLLAGLRPAVALFSKEEVEGKLLPQVGKMIKRAADVSAPVAAHLLECTEVDLGGAAVGFSGVLLSAARHSKADVRAAAQRCMKALAQNIKSDAEAAGEVAAAVLVRHGGRVKDVVRLMHTPCLTTAVCVCEWLTS